MRQRWFTKLIACIKHDENFLILIKKLETVISKILSIALLIIILVALVELGIYLTQEIFLSPVGFYGKTIIEVFGMFLNILIALELLENITAYLKKHVVHVELVIVTALIAVARKIIIFDFKQYSGIDLIGLGLASVALAVSYWLIRRMNQR
ncbi:MAG: phosphate-starvation-inducible PsiE family protein [Microcystaceae cyanobacterium]